MGGRDNDYSIVYRGKTLEYFKEGEWVFFQRSKESGGGYWFGRTYSDCFWLEFDRPTSLSQGIEYIISLGCIRRKDDDVDEFRLE